MSTVLILIIILGSGAGILTFFIIKTVLQPKRVATLANLLKQGKYSAVVRTAKQILAKEPRNSEAHYLIGKAYMGDNKPELALMELQTVNEIGDFGGACPEIEFRETIAGLFERFKQPEEALKEYLLLLKKDPGNPEYYFKSGEFFEARDKSEKAANYYRKTIELDPRHGMAHFRLGQILYRAKKPVEARAELETAIKILPENYNAYFYLGRLVKESHDYATALHLFEKAQRDPELKVKALVERGGCYMNMKSFDSAISELERALKLSNNDSSPETLYGRYFLAACYENKRQIDKAIEQWEAIYKKKSSFRDVAEKLSQYQELRQDDRVKDYLTAGMEEFYQICKDITVALNLGVRDLTNIPNGCQIVAVEAESKKWLNARKMPTLLWFLRIPDIIPESTIRNLHEEMKKLNVTRGALIASSNFHRKAVEYAETRPINLFNQEKLQKLLEKADSLQKSSR